MIQTGDTVRYPNTWTHWGNEAKFGMSFADREPLRRRYPHGPYSMLGPVEVTGARPGDVIEVSITALRTIGWGWNSFPLGVGALPHDFAEPYVHYFTFDDARTTAEHIHGITLPMAPFLGVVAAEPAGEQPVSAIVSGSYGGNLVLRDLGVGSHLFLPVAKPGGRMWTGDVHALQGDGVVDQTAVETAAEDLQIRYDVHKQVALRGPLGETNSSWIVVAFAASLDDALVACLREVIYWLPAAAGITGPEAYALASMAVSFRVTQYANQNRVGLHLDPAQGRARGHPQEHLPGGTPRPDRGLATAMTLSAADRLAILEVITRADEAASRRDADAYVALFTPDAVLDGTQGRHAGQAALRAAVGPVWAAEGPATLHLTLNPVIEPGPADHAVARSVLLIIDPGRAARPPRRRGDHPGAPPYRRLLAHHQAHRRACGGAALTRGPADGRSRRVT